MVGHVDALDSSDHRGASEATRLHALKKSIDRWLSLSQDWFDYKQVASLFERYLNTRTCLGDWKPEIFSDLPVHEVPTAQPGSRYTAERSELEALANDVEYTLDVLIGRGLHKPSADLHETTTVLSSAKGTDSAEPLPVGTVGKKVFIVHGRNEHMKEATARLVSNLGLDPVILHEQANMGRTISDKFRDHATEAVYAIVLLTPDDLGSLDNVERQEFRPRARQNVILELGFFLGVLENRVCAVKVGDIETPSDYDGVLYIPFDVAGLWKLQIAKEMKAVGLPVDVNRLI